MTAFTSEAPRFHFTYIGRKIPIFSNIHAKFTWYLYGYNKSFALSKKHTPRVLVNNALAGMTRYTGDS